MSERLDIPERNQAGPRPAPSSPPPEAVEDAGSRALAEALRSSFIIIKVVMVILVLVFLFSGFFTVGTQEKAILLRFGKPVGTDERALLGPGPHWAFPYPIDEVIRIPVGQAQTVTSTIGWYATTPAAEATGTEPPPGDSLDPRLDGYLLTADGNIIHGRGTLRYRIREPGLGYVFDFVSASNLVQNAFNNALIYAASGYSVDNALSRDIAGFRDRVRARLEQLVAQQALSIVVDQIDLQSIPPRKLKESFDAVLEAEVKRAKALNDARSYANETVSKARGEAAIRVNAGETDRARLVEFLAAEAKRFTGLLPEYRKNPELFVKLRTTETLQRVFTNAQDKIILPERRDGKPIELRLQLGREPDRPKPPEQPKNEDKH
jgi:membrane protease subunit HflK